MPDDTPREDTAEEADQSASAQEPESDSAPAEEETSEKPEKAEDAPAEGQKIKADVDGAKEATPAKKRRVLVVEDSTPLRRMLVKILQTLDFTGFDAENGRVALDIIAEKGPDHFDLLLVDLMMPVLDGAHFVAEAKKTYGDAMPPVLICSSRSDREAIQVVMKLGVAGYILKPFKTDTVIGKVRELFEDLQVEKSEA